MKRTVLSAAAVAAVAGLLLSACSSSSELAADSARPTASTSVEQSSPETSEPAPPATPHVPAPGDCWNGNEPVDCASPHTSETVSFFTESELGMPGAEFAALAERFSNGTDPSPEDEFDYERYRNAGAAVSDMCRALVLDRLDRNIPGGGYFVSNFASTVLPVPAGTDMAARCDIRMARTPDGQIPDTLPADLTLFDTSLEYQRCVVPGETESRACSSKDPGATWVAVVRGLPVPKLAKGQDPKDISGPLCVKAVAAVSQGNLQNGDVGAGWSGMKLPPKKAIKEWNKPGTTLECAIVLDKWAPLSTGS